MNIKDFLIENYIWLLVIILITIVTIIGFLADKKRGGKKEKNVQQTTPQNVNNQPVNPQLMNNQQLNNQSPIQYQQPQDIQSNQMNNNMGMNFNNMNTTVRPLNQMNNQQTMTTEPQPMMYTMPQAMQPMSNPVETINNPQPVENIAPNIVQEPMYQPLSEQKPVIAPQPVPNFSNMQAPVNTESNQVQPMPANQVQSETNTLNVISSVSPTMIPQSESMMAEPTLNTIPMYNSQPQPESIQNNNFNTVPNFIPNKFYKPQTKHRFRNHSNKLLLKFSFTFNYVIYF